MELKPCPFCGNTDLYKGAFAYWTVSCKKCPASQKGETEKEAIQAWNTRSEADRIKQLEAEVEKYKMLAEDRKDDAEVLSETIDDIIKLKENLYSAESFLQQYADTKNWEESIIPSPTSVRKIFKICKLGPKPAQEYFQNKKGK